MAKRVEHPSLHTFRDSLPFGNLRRDHGRIAGVALSRIDPGAARPFHSRVLLVPVRADLSAIHGLGLFAVAPIRAGTPVWRFVPGFDQAFDEARFASLPIPAQQHLRHYGFFDQGRRRWVLDADLAIFMNHHPAPNTGAPGTDGAADLTLALRDIAIGEELTCDYRAFDASSKPIP